MKTFTVIKNELLRYFYSPLAYVYLTAFLVLNGAFAFYFGHFLEREQADLLPMFAFQPWLYLLFISGISMRLWAEEFKSRTIVQIITMPVSVSSLVWGKFFAAWIFCGIALFLTFPFWISVNYLGYPDNDVIALGYFGSLMLAGCMIAVAQTMSTLTKNQVIAMVLAVIANLLFFLSSLELVLSFFRMFTPQSILDMISSFSFISHFESLTFGLLELRDIIYFVSVILLFNFMSIVIVSFKTFGSSKFLQSTRALYYVLVFACLIIGFIGINLIANNLLRNFKADFTQDKTHTVSSATEDILQNLPEPVIAKLYYSKILSERSSEFNNAFDQVRQLLKTYKDLSRGKFDYNIYHPQILNDAEDRALSAGLQSIPVVNSNQTAFFGLSLSNEKNITQTVPLFLLENTGRFEEEITRKIYLLSHQKKNLGVITSLPIIEQEIGQMVSQRWEIVNRLSEFYNLHFITNSNPDIKDIEALLLIHPQGMSEQMVQNIKAYSNTGGKILLLADIAAEAGRNALPTTQRLSPSELNGLDTFWGFKFNTEYAVADLGNSITVDASRDYNKNPVFIQDILQFILSGSNLHQIFPETKPLREIMFASTGSISPQKNADISFSPLISAGPVSSLIPSSSIYDNSYIGTLLEKFIPDKEPKVIGAKISSNNPEHPWNLIVIADTDFIYDSFWSKQINVMNKTYVVDIFDNANLVLNALDSLTGNNRLLSLRSSKNNSRKMLKIEQMRKLGQQEFKIKEQEIINKINNSKKMLAEIWGKRSFEGRQNFTTDELALLSKIRQQLEELRQELSSSRNLISQKQQNLENSLKFINIYAIPLIIIILLLLVYLRQKNNAPKEPLECNLPLIIFAAAALLLLSAGIWSVYLGNQSSISEYEGKNFFTKLPSQINNIAKIIIKSHNQSLEFYQNKNGLWQLQDKENYLVYNNRIRHFLNAMSQAQYYEKKSDKLENLPLFNLQDTSSEKSPSLQIILQNNQGQDIENFFVGKYDIPLGRGSRLAFMRFNKQFQVWEVKADLINIEPLWQEWTYSNLWNLAFGRIKSINGSTNTDALADIIKKLLNTYSINSGKNFTGTEVFTLNIISEDNTDIAINFYQQEDKAYVKYVFNSAPQNQTLKDFAQTTADIYYEINFKDMENIKNALPKSE